MGHWGFMGESSDVATLGTTYRHGEVIFREGDKDNALYIVQAGRVRLVATLPSGREIEIAAAGSSRSHRSNRSPQFPLPLI